MASARKATLKGVGEKWQRGRLVNHELYQLILAFKMSEHRFLNRDGVLSCFMIGSVQFLGISTNIINVKYYLSCRGIYVPICLCVASHL